MGASPRFDRAEAFDPRRIRFGDIDGSGTSDIAYLRPDGVALYLNQSGNRWSDPLLVAGIPGRPDTSIDLVDLLGTGTACLVWSSPEPGDGGLSIRYVDLLASTKPHLLSCVTNNLGLKTRILYSASTRFYLEDRAAGSPWVTRLPFPVQVVERVEITDDVQGSHLVRTYRYKHGFFDGCEREFRGFGRVDEWDAERFLPSAAGELVVPPTHTITWIDTGVWREARDLYAQYRTEQYALDPAAPPLADPEPVLGRSAAEEREAARARKGTVLRREVYAEDGLSAENPYLVEEHRYAVTSLQPMRDQRHPVWFQHIRESVVRNYERAPADPRVEHRFILEVDLFGNIVRSANVAYPRRSPVEPEQSAILATCADASFSNTPAPFKGGTDLYRVGTPVEMRSYELAGLAAPTSALLAFDDVDRKMKDAATIAFDGTPTPGKVEKRVIVHRRTLYVSDDLTTALPLGDMPARKPSGPI